MKNKKQYLDGIGLSDSTYKNICEIMRYTGVQPSEKGEREKFLNRRGYKDGTPCVTTLLNNLDRILSQLGSIPESDKKIIQNLVDAQQQAKKIGSEIHLNRIKTAAKSIKPSDPIKKLSGIISTRTLNALAGAEIFTIDDLLQFIKVHGLLTFSKLRNIGKTSLQEIQQLVETVEQNVSEQDKLEAQLRDIDAQIAEFNKSRENILKRLYEIEQSQKNIITQSQTNNQKD